MELVLDFIEKEFKACENEARKQGSFEGQWEPTEVDFESIHDRVKENFQDADNAWELVDLGWDRYRKAIH